LQVEGDVLLDVELTVGGTVRVLQIVAGLEAGLNEAAIDAVKKIKYRPALKGGRAVDERRRIRVVFKLTRDTR
jgi:protein TonB